MCWNEHLLWTFPSVYSSYSSLSKARSFSLISSQDGVASEVGDAAEVATVTCHQDVSLVAPFLTPAVKKRQKMDLEITEKMKYHQESNSISAYHFDRWHENNNQPTLNFSGHLSHLMPFRQVTCPTCSLQSSTSSPWCSLHSLLPVRHDWRHLCYSWDRSKHLGSQQREREKKRVSCISEQCINDVPRTLFNVEYNQKVVDVLLCLIVLLAYTDHYN